MNAPEFIAKWRRVQLSERSASQQHFLDLCELLGHDTPAAADPEGTHFTFERGARKLGGEDGWADVWKRDFFGWEYKGKHRDLDKAYAQLLLYREDLGNPPLLVVCDMDRIVVHTNFTSTPKRVHTIPLDDLGAPRSLEVLRAVFFEPDKLKPGVTSQAVTEDAARHIGDIAQALPDRGHAPDAVAHFLDRLVFCMFAEDVGLLPNRLFSRLIDNARHDPERFGRQIGQLFAAMAGGGDFGADVIRRFNGNLFTADGVLPLTEDQIGRLHAASQLDWSAVDASIFGTLFERGLDPDKRSQLGAHYTSREDIETLVEPVVMQPLRRDWADTRRLVVNLMTTGKKNPPPPSVMLSEANRPAAPPSVMLSEAKHPAAPGAAPSPSVMLSEAKHPDAPGAAPPLASTPSATATPAPRKLSASALTKARREAEIILDRVLNTLATVKVLDPACGSGNFLYVTLQKLKDLEKEVIVFGQQFGLGFFPRVGPWQLHGIEINRYAHELAQMTIWIGYLQWIRFNGFEVPADPILKPMDTFHCMDAILDLSDRDHPKEPEWPAVDFIVGNPPFLGGKLLRRWLGDDYVNGMFALWSDRVPPEADLCCYWFEKARANIEAGKCKRAGLLATQGIRGGANRKVLERIKQTGDIFFAESDRRWILDGANVHVSMVGFDAGTETARRLDGGSPPVINTNLTGAVDVTSARRLRENANFSFMGDTKGGPFELTDAEALDLLRQPNPHGRPNSDVLVPWVNGLDITRRPRGMWIVDFPPGCSEREAALYEAVFAFVEKRVRPSRTASRSIVSSWWLHERPRPDMRSALGHVPRFAATVTVSKHRIFTWLASPSLPDHQLIVFGRSDDYFLGVLHSRAHEVWARALGTQVRERESGFRYTPTTCFETFPFPWPPGHEPADDPRVRAIADAARELNELRERWLNPPEWTKEEILEFPGSIDGPWSRYVHDADARGIGTVRWRRRVPKDADCAARLKSRTLTNLYNQRPAWLANAHAVLNTAVFSADGGSPSVADDALLAALFVLNFDRVRSVTST